MVARSGGLEVPLAVVGGGGRSCGSLLSQALQVCHCLLTPWEGLTGHRYRQRHDKASFLPLLQGLAGHHYCCHHKASQAAASTHCHGRALQAAYCATAATASARPPVVDSATAGRLPSRPACRLGVPDYLHSPRCTAALWIGLKATAWQPSPALEWWHLPGHCPIHLCIAPSLLQGL